MIYLLCSILAQFADLDIRSWSFELNFNFNSWLIIQVLDESE